MQRSSWQMALCCGIGFCLFGLAIAPFASATIYSYSASAAPSAAPDSNGTTDIWLVSVSELNLFHVGDFIGDSAANGDHSGAGAGSSAWAIYANNGQSVRASASVIGIAGAPLSLANQYISLNFDNGFVNTGSTVGINFFDSSNVVQLAFEFVGGASYYQVTDSGGQHLTSPTLGFTDDGFNVKLTLNHNSNGQYTLNAGPSFSISGTLRQATSQISKIEVFNVNAGPDAERNVYFNNLVVSTAVPEVPASVLLAVVGTVIMGANKWKSLRRARHTASKSASPAI